MDTNKTIVGISQVGGLVGIVYSFNKNTGVLKGFGNYLLGSLVFGLGAMAYYNLKKD
jgi:hypothetical protein